LAVKRKRIETSSKKPLHTDRESHDFEQNAVRLIENKSTRSKHVFFSKPSTTPESVVYRLSRTTVIRARNNFPKFAISFRFPGEKLTRPVRRRKRSGIYPRYRLFAYVDRSVYSCYSNLGVYIYPFVPSRKHDRFKRTVSDYGFERRLKKSRRLAFILRECSSPENDAIKGEYCVSAVNDRGGVYADRGRISVSSIVKRYVLIIANGPS